jgi:RsiW-degrading membrane proteinase PrsW (M82 family)
MNRTLLFLTGLGAAALAAFGGLSFLLYTFWPLFEQGRARPNAADGVIAAAELGVLGVLGLVLGFGLLWHASRDLQARRSAPFRVPSWTVPGAVLLFPLVIVAGLNVLHWSRTAQGYVFPLAQLLVVVLPAVVALGLVERAGRTPPLRLVAAPAGGLTGRDSRGDPHGEPLRQAVLGPPSWRRVVSALSWGMTGGALLAIVLEIAAAVAALAVVAVFLGATGQGGQLDQWLTALQDPGALGASGDDAVLQTAFSNPLVVLTLILAVGLVVPLIEETVKSLAVVILGRRLGSPRDGFLYGVAAGAGFGMLENVFYNVNTLDDWWSTAVLRFGTILMHALASGLVGLGWYYALRRKERRRLLGLGLAAVALHGLWNASQIVIIKLTVDLGGGGDPFALIAAGNGAGWAVLAWNAGLTLVTALLLITIPLRLAQATVRAQTRRNPPPALSATAFPARPDYSSLTTDH